MSTAWAKVVFIFFLAPLSVSARQLRAGAAGKSSFDNNSKFRKLLTGDCDESKEATQKPIDAMMMAFQADSKFPVGSVGQCGDDDGFDIDGMPASPARPSIFKRCMFGVNNATGKCYMNFNHHDLPIVDTYYDEHGRPTDVYAPLTTDNPLGVDLFKFDDGEDDSCRPVDYNGTNGFFLYGSPSVGLDHYFPAPTIKNCRSRQGVVRFENRANRAPISVHLHGAASVAPYDGWANDVTDVDYAKNYFYPNNRPTTLWYHDHSVHITSNNAYAGLAGEYIIKDCESPLEQEYLPDEEHSIPFILKDATLQSMGDFKYDLLYDKLRDHKNNLYGDINMVNGVAWPKLDVDPVTYRLRSLDVSITRPFFLKFLAVSEKGQQAWLPFWLVQSDGGNLKEMIRTYSLFIAVAERYTFLVNFNTESHAYPELTTRDDYWKHVYAVNDFGKDSKAPPMFCKTHLLARFDILNATDNANFRRGVDYELLNATPEVLKAVTDKNDTTVPTSMAHPFKALRNLAPQSVIDKYIQRARAGQADRVFDFGRSGGRWAINGCTWDNAECRIIANPSRNGYELWHLKGHGGWFHPVHIHLIDFLVLRRKSTDAADLWVDYDPLEGSSPGDKFTTIGARDGLRPWEVGAAKDVVHLGHGQDVWVLTLWGPHDGDFMFHCHNLVHEDNDMMVAAGVGRSDGVNGQIFFAANGEREDVTLDTVAQADEFYEASGSQIKLNEWKGTEDKFEGIDGSPYSPQFEASGEINRGVRTGMGDRARVIKSDPSWDASVGALNSTYVCSEICKGFYAVFYPDPTTDNGKDQLAYRRGYESTSDNPIRKNIWAVPYYAFSDATSNNFATVNRTHDSHNCTCA